MKRFVTICLMVFSLLYAVALGLFLIGNFGLFGNEPDPLAAVFLMPLGMPWNFWIDLFPESTWPWLAAAAPSLNCAALWIISKTVR